MSLAVGAFCGDRDLATVDFEHRSVRCGVWSDPPPCQFDHQWKELRFFWRTRAIIVCFRCVTTSFLRSYSWMWMLSSKEVMNSLKNKWQICKQSLRIKGATEGTLMLGRRVPVTTVTGHCVTPWTSVLQTVCHQSSFREDI